VGNPFVAGTNGDSMNILRADFRAIAQATEDEVRVENALKFAAGAGEVNKTHIAGHFGNRMTIMSMEMRIKKDIKDFIMRLKDAGILRSLVDEVEERIDEECVLHFRLDKQKAYEEMLELAHSNDVIDCGIKIAAYPARRENAVKIAKEIFKGVLNKE
jgi:RNA binding exosome subunit